MKKTIESPKTKNTPVKRAVNQPGGWMFKPLKSTVITCKCGNKYIVTRLNQTECVDCSFHKPISR